MSDKPIRDYVELVLRLQAQLKGTVASDIRQADRYSSEQWQEIVRHNRTWLEAKSLTAAMDQPIEVDLDALQNDIELLRLELAAYTGNGSHPTSADTAALSTTDDSRQPSDWETQAKSQCLSMLESLPSDFKPLPSVAVMTEQVADQVDANVSMYYDANDAWLLMTPRPTVSIEDIGALVKQLPSRLFECLGTKSQLGTLPEDQAELTTESLPENVLYAKARKLLGELNKIEALAPTTGTLNSDVPWQVPSHVQWSDTFATLDIAGTTYKFSPSQSFCMQVMLKAYEAKGQTVFSSEEVLGSADRDLKSKRLRDVFKHSQFWQDGRMKTAPNARGCVKINLEKN